MLTMLRIVATAFGRPHRLPEPNTVPLPAEIDDEYLSTITEGQQPVNSYSKMTFLIQTLKLSAIADKALSHKEHYVQKDMRDWSNQDLGLILDVSTEIEQFLAGLPVHLQADTHSNYGSLPFCFALQAHVLKARYKPPQ
jgi:hypothetical protein